MLSIKRLWKLCLENNSGTSGMQPVLQWKWEYLQGMVACSSYTILTNIQVLLNGLHKGGMDETCVIENVQGDNYSYHFWIKNPQIFEMVGSFLVHFLPYLFPYIK